MRTHHGLYYDSRIKLLLILLTSALAFALGGGLTGLLLFGVVWPIFLPEWALENKY